MISQGETRKPKNAEGQGESGKRDLQLKMEENKARNKNST